MNLSTQKSQGLNIKGKNMLTKLINFFLIKQRTNTPVVSSPNEETELIETIKNAKAEWVKAFVNFEYAESQDIVDYYTYNLKACEIRYEYFLKKAKEKGLKVEKLEGLDKINIRY